MRGMSMKGESSGGYNWQQEVRYEFPAGWLAGEKILQEDITIKMSGKAKTKAVKGNDNGFYVHQYLGADDKKH